MRHRIENPTTFSDPISVDVLFKAASSRKVQRISVVVSVGDTVRTAKDMINAKVGIPPDQQKLKHRGKLLNDAQILSEDDIDSVWTLRSP